MVQIPGVDASSCPIHVATWSLGLQSPSCVSSFCSPKKTPGKAVTLRREHFYKNIFGLERLLCVSHRQTEVAGAGTLPLRQFSFGFCIFVLFLQVHQRNPAWKENRKRLSAGSRTSPGGCGGPHHAQPQLPSCSASGRTPVAYKREGCLMRTCIENCKKQQPSGP